MELWKQIPFAHLYEISSLGRIRNLKTKKVKQAPNIEKLKKKQTRVRYILKTNVKTSKDGMKGFYLHRIIAQTFLENPNNCTDVNHIDGNPYNNTLSNVEIRQDTFDPTNFGAGLAEGDFVLETLYNKKSEGVSTSGNEYEKLYSL